jgi:hypothetical protein
MAKIDIIGADAPDDVFKKYSNAVFNVSAIGANTVRRLQDKKMSGETWVAILFEFIFFYVALTSELGLYDSPEERRERIVSRLSEYLIPPAVDYVLEDLKGNGNRVAKEHFLEECAARVEQYARFPHAMPIEGEDRLERTALGAFGHRVAELAGEPGDPAHVMTVHMHVQDSIDVLNIDIFAALAG